MKDCPAHKGFFPTLVWGIICCCFFMGNAQGQLCTGSFGDPIVNITFGNGPNATALGSDVTTYSFVNTDCPSDGSYTLRSTSANCFGTWHAITSDHTGDPQGRFMLANASFDPGDFFVQKVNGLCANTTFEFAVWVMNMVRIPNQIQPNLTFTIEKTDGTILGSFLSGDIGISSAPQWRKVGFNFKTPPGVSEVVLRIRNNAPGGIGNDIALDDITFRACGPSLTNTLDGSVDTLSLCEGEIKTFQLNATVPPFFVNPLYQWQISTDQGASWNDIAGANALQLTITPQAVGSYWYRLAAAEAENFSLQTCRVASNVTAVNIHANPAISAGPDQVVVKGESIMLQGVLQGENAMYSWHPLDHMNNAASLTPNVSPVSNISYTLSAESVYGCSASDTVAVKVINGIYIPTSFTPNGDGVNDTWRIPYIEYAPDAEVKIYNRYGNLIFQKKGGAVMWDGTTKGKLQPAGVYIYLVTLKKGTAPLKGFLTILR